MTQTQQEPMMAAAISDEIDLFSLASFRALFETPWQPQRIRESERRVVHRELRLPETPVETRVRELGSLPASNDPAYEAERWDGLG